MNIDTILAGKGRDVVTVSSDETLAAAARLLDRHRIGAAIVVDGSGALIGIVSERDLVRAVARSGPAALDEEVASNMTRKVVTCTGASAVDEVLGLMTDGKFRHVPVLKAGRLDGLVSIGDIVKHKLAEIEAEHRAMRDYITAGG